MSFPPTLRQVGGFGAPSYGRLIEIYPIAEQVLRNCKLKEGEKVIVYTDTKKNRNLVDAFWTAALNLGTEAFMIMTTRTGSEGGLSATGVRPEDLALEAIRKADFIIDLPSVNWQHTQLFQEILRRGTRAVTVNQPEDSIIRLRPETTLTGICMKRMKNGAEWLSKADEVRIISKAGTDVTMSIKGRNGVWTGAGVADQPGKWDSFPGATVEAAPIEDTAEGRWVIAPGDFILPLYRIATERTVFQIRNGQIVGIEGDNEADLIQAWFDQWNNKNSYHTSHVGFGAHPKAEAMSMAHVEWESIAGIVTLAFGSNTIGIFGGKNDAPSHFDSTARRNTFYLDGEMIIENGKFVHPDFA